MKFIQIIFAIILGVQAQADTQINWQSDFNATNLQSDGVTPLDDTFEFALGGFIDGFVPGPDNVSDWELKWRELGTTAYREDNFFSQGTVLKSNEAPFRVNGMDRVYIWGHNGKTTGSEWILISKSDWEWPAAGVGPPVPGGGPSWQVASTSGSDAVLGSVNNGGVQMQTAKIVLNVSYAEWVSANFMAGEASDVDEDPDGDGIRNLLEYAIGTNPKLADAKAFFTITSDFRLILDRAPGRPVVWTLEDSGTLQGFSEMENGFTLLSDEPARLIYQLTEPRPSKRFYRVVASLPEE